jgi:hypothetical protein
LRKTADCLSEEKREGTLGLLFLTDLKGYDVILGKLSATSLNSIYGLLAMLPILALSLVLGGVTPGEFWRMALALANLLFFSLCAGIWVSARSESERNAVVGTCVLIGAFLSLPSLTRQAPLYVISPGFPYNSAFDAAYLTDPNSYWRSLLITQLLCWSLLAWASLTIRWSWQDKVLSGPAMRWQQWQQHRKFGNPSQRAKLRAQLLEINPALWLASRNLFENLRVWIVLPVAVVVAIALIARISPIRYLIVVAIYNFCLLILLALHAGRGLADVRRNQAWETLLSTPLSTDQILRGQITAVERIFRVPMIIAVLLEILGLGSMMIALGDDSGAGVIVCVVVATIYLSSFALNALAVTWAGMWFGFSSKSGTQAAFKTIAYVLLVPLLGFPLCFFGLPILFVWPLIWFLWSKQKVQSEFRKLALQQYSFDPKAAGWWSSQANKPAQAPPIIYAPKR